MNDPLATIQTAYAAFGRGDLPALLSMMTDDVEWTFAGDCGAAYTGTSVGRDAVGAWFGAVMQADDIQAFEPRQFLAGPDHVTVIGHERTVARATGRAFESPWVHVWTVHDGRIARFYGIFDSEAAARARA
jgi:hypothetical protein